MKATTGFTPPLTTVGSLTCASAMRSPRADSPAGLAVLVMSAVMVPSSLFAIGAIKVL